MKFNFSQKNKIFTIATLLIISLAAIPILKKIQFRADIAEPTNNITAEIVYKDSQNRARTASSNTLIMKTEAYPLAVPQITALSNSIGCAQMAKIVWQAPAGASVSSYFLYRDGKKIASVTGSTLSFIDRFMLYDPKYLGGMFIGNKNIVYGLVAQAADGRKSIMVTKIIPISNSAWCKDINTPISPKISDLKVTKVNDLNYSVSYKTDLPTFDQMAYGPDYNVDNMTVAAGSSANVHSFNIDLIQAIGDSFYYLNLASIYISSGKSSYTSGTFSDVLKFDKNGVISDGNRLIIPVTKDEPKDMSNPATKDEPKDMSNNGSTDNSGLEFVQNEIISGVVTDKDGPVKNAKVKVLEGKKVLKSTDTNAKGEYTLAGIKVGSDEKYTLKITKGTKYRKVVPIDQKNISVLENGIVLKIFIYLNDLLHSIL